MYPGTVCLWFKRLVVSTEHYLGVSSKMAKQVWISDLAYEYCRKVAYEQHKPIGKVTSEAILSNVIDTPSKGV